MAKITKVAEAADIAPGQGKMVQADDKAVAIFNVEGTFYAIDNTCAHRGGPLGEGDLDACIVTCPWHGWQWDVRTGANAANPSVKVAAYPVTVEGGSVFVEV